MINTNIKDDNWLIEGDFEFEKGLTYYNPNEKFLIPRKEIKFRMPIEGSLSPEKYRIFIEELAEKLKQDFIVFAHSK